METRLRVLVSILVVLAAFAGGWYMGNGQVTVEEINKETRTEIQYKDRIVTVTKTVQPDGTIVESTKTEDKSGSKLTEKKSSETTTTPALAHYSVGAGLARHVDFDSILEPKLGDYYVSGGMRVLGPGWVEVQYQPNANEVRLGIRVEL